MEVFSVRLREMRLKKGFRQKDMADLLGITPRAYQYYEEGKRYPDFRGLLLLAEHLNVSIDYLVGRTDDK
ncbi:helix-turn-helix domain-containing protein [Intestinimonas massiliensis]|uniref:Helix-turn-helix domain-containing protein n=1 Tax=Intestinimonas massiliensis (ex Afouda et al. 2020) TaxID=1673721 RepID=A0ABS9MBM7_9FIRM|nr:MULTISPECIES: helix-turn-helix transcriptional regulator [Intestinimonas]MCG4528191.1 helix-turn-helix domain-containing protein [Intestinimonas massiliensis (ex Afouda et al. 2020)]MCI5563286.1 helix-turn-helix domain-containing protein [Intestinimonas massiliensis (ex Afouda et al. 2020)]MCQ4805433.1 helix-turn-helix domain-containing protein [Intestinimonas massiliensis (ex Afouda et al. 2020)]MDY5338549.1 helix-turn-helix transcriptional regulator [Intestinimonas sp.]